MKPTIGLFGNEVKNQIHKEMMDGIYNRLSQIEEWILKKEECEMEESDQKVVRDPIDHFNMIWQRLEMIDRWMVEHEREGQEYGAEFEARDEEMIRKMTYLQERLIEVAKTNELRNAELRKEIEMLKEKMRLNSPVNCQHIAVQHPGDLARRCGLCGAFY